MSSLKFIISTIIASAFTASAAAAEHRDLPKLPALISCFKQAVPNAREQVVLLEPIDSEATGDRHQSGMPQPLLTQHVAHTLYLLGFHPILMKRGNLDQVKGDVNPDFVVRGSITSFDALTERTRDSRDGGIGGGGGRGAFNFNAGKESTQAKGSVSVVINIESLQKIRNGAIYKITASESVSGEFSMHQSQHQMAGSLVLGFGGGYARERLSVVDVQSATRIAASYAVVLAFAQQLRASSPVCSS